MPQIIEVPGQGQVEFPDGMSDEQIVSAIKSLPRSQIGAPDEPGAFEAGIIAAGRGTDKIVQGVRELYNKAVSDSATLSKMADEQAENDRLYKPLQEAHPVATAIGEAAPMMAIPVGAATAPAFVAKTALAGAAPGLLSYGSIDERLKAGALGGAGGAVGGAIGLGVARALKPAGIQAGLSKEATSAAERLGMKLSPGQITQNPALQNFENYLARSPGSSGAMQVKALANQTALNRAAAKAMGQRSDDLGEGAFSAAKNAIGAEFERLQNITSPQLGNDFLNAVAQVDTANMARGSFKNAKIDKLIDKSIDLAAKGKLSGAAYKEIRSELSAEASSAFKSGDATVGQAYKAIRKALDDAAEASLNASDKKAWALTREQWKAYKTLTQSNVSEAGNVSAARLAAAVRRQGDGLRTGAAKGPLADIARVGESVKGVQNPNSGQLTQQMLYGNPLTGIPMVVGNKAAQMGYTAPLVEAYLTNGLLDIGQNGALVLGKAAAPLGAPLAKQYLGAQ